MAVASGILIGTGVASGAAASLNLTSQSFTPYRTCTLSATPTTTNVVTDATVRQGSPTSNFGALTSLTISSGSAVNQRTYVRFDLTVCAPAIPSSAVVRLATLRLYVTAVPAACRTIDMFAASAAWTEAAITWNNQPLGAAINNPAAASRIGTFMVGTPVGCQNQNTGVYVTGATVTTDVAAYVAGGSTNLGWMLRDDAEGSATTRTVTFASKNLGTIAQVPQLVITYVVVP